MTVKIEQLSEEPIILYTYSNPYKANEEIQAVIDGATELTAGIPGTVYAIHDVHNVKVSFSELVSSMGTAIKSFRELKPDFLERTKTILVGTSSLLKLAADSFNQVQYGELSVELFDTVNEALAYARGEIDGN